ncbi:trehalose utilization-domain-containing protein [Schizophyllum commune]
MIPTTLFTLSSLSGLALAASTPRVLIYSATEQFRHDSIPTAVQALKDAGYSASITFDATEDKSLFTDDNLKQYDALVFLSNTGEVLDDDGIAAFQKYLNLGGNFIGIHSATDCLNTTEFYGREIGAYFDYHPELTNATVDVLDRSHPSTSMLPEQWQVRDEMYNFKSDPRNVGAVVILSADESTYNGGFIHRSLSLHVLTERMKIPARGTWYQEKGAGVQDGNTAGRSFYTSLGHLNETWNDDTFMAHVMGGIKWALEANTTRAFNSSASVGNGQAGNASSTASDGAAQATQT